MTTATRRLTVAATRGVELTLCDQARRRTDRQYRTGVGTSRKSCLAYARPPGHAARISATTRHPAPRNPRSAPCQATWFCLPFDLSRALAHHTHARTHTNARARAHKHTLADMLISAHRGASRQSVVEPCQGPEEEQVAAPHGQLQVPSTPLRWSTCLLQDHRGQAEAAAASTMSVMAC